MKNFFKTVWKSIGIPFIAVIFLTGFFLYFSYNMLLSPSSLTKITGPQEGYYWIVSQNQIYFERLETQLLSLSIAEDASKLNLYHQILKSKLDLLSKPSELTSFFNKIDQYQETIARLQLFMQQLDNDIPALQNNKGNVHKILALFNNARADLSNLAKIVHLEELNIREQMQEDFYQKRKLLYAGACLLWLFFIALISSFRRIHPKSQPIIH